MLLLLAVRLQLSCARFLPVKGGGGSRHICDANIPLPPPRPSQVKLDPEQPPLHLSTGRAAKPISSRISLIRDFNMCHPPGGVGGGGSGGGLPGTHTATPPCLDSLLQLPGLPVAWACISAQSRSHVTPSSMPLGGGAVTHSHSSTYTHTHPKMCVLTGEFVGNLPKCNWNVCVCIGMTGNYS